MHHNSKIISINWLSSKNKHKDSDLIEEIEQRNLRFMEILKRYGFEIYKETFISKVLNKVNAIQKFIYNKSIEYIYELSGYENYDDSKITKSNNLIGILGANFTINDMIKEASELSLSEVSLLLNKIKFWLPTTTLNKNQKLTIIIEPVANYFLNQISNDISIAVLVKKNGLFHRPFELTRVSIPFADQSDYDIENNLSKVILLTKFYLFLDDIKWTLLAGAIGGDKCQAN